MHVVVMGCGRVGSMLALRTVEMGHTVAVIDQDPASFDRLGAEFPGTCVTGVGFDRRTLVQASIRDAAAFAAVSSGDNTNVIAARVAREEYGVRNVVARIYDPRRAEIYERLGIATVATVRWTAHQMMARLLPGSPDHEYRDVSGRLTMLVASCEPSWVGTPIGEVERRTRARVAFVTRLGEGLLPGAETRVQDGDRLHLMAETTRLDEVETVLAHPRAEDAESTGPATGRVR
ncbi:potassium channel family protein [Brachybacterium sp. AOP25-B2-12]|uniref:potassium channel family protein n=1 Tax=Brachybacterium sp. AOP25-B2-12 TaxID=3457710 RepID=UPI004033B539